MATKKIQIINGASIIPQSDWNQTDETKSDYIKNKPEISKMFVIDISKDSTGEYDIESIKATMLNIMNDTNNTPVFIKSGDWIISGAVSIFNKRMSVSAIYTSSETDIFVKRIYFNAVKDEVQVYETEGLNAESMLITDEGDYYTSLTVEGALQEMGEALDKFTYVSPTVTLAVGGANSTEELGKVLSSVTISATANKECKSLKLYSGSTLLQSAEKATSVSATVENVSTTTTFKVVATDKYDKNIQKTSTISFYNGIYYGVASDGVSISKLSKRLQGNNNCEFSGNAGAGQYFFFASPKRYGTPSFKDKDTGFGADFTLVDGNVVFTNASGYEEAYQLYRSTHPALGQTTITVY